MDSDKKPSRRHRGEKAATPTPWWVKHFQERPIAMAGTLATLAGGLILLWFFLSLGESPDLDLASFGAVPLAIALVGFAVAAALTGCSFAAGLGLRDKKSLAGLDPKWTAGFLIAPGMASTVLLVIYLAFWPDGKPAAEVMWFPFGAMLALSALISVYGPEPVSSTDGGDEWTPKKRFAELFSLGLLWVLMAYVALFTFWVLFPRDGASRDFLWGLLFWTLLCYALNLMVGWAPRPVYVVVPMSIVLGLMGLFSATGNWQSFPRAVVGALGMGEMPVSLIVSADGCDYLNKRVGDRAVCRVEPGKKGAVVCPAMLRSRIGSPFFVGLSAFEPEGQWPQLHGPKRLEAIAIPKADVLSWVRLDPPVVKHGSVAASAPAGIVTYLDAADPGKWLREQCNATVAAASASAPASSASGVTGK